MKSLINARTNTQELLSGISLLLALAVVLILRAGMLAGNVLHILWDVAGAIVGVLIGWPVTQRTYREMGLLAPERE